MHLLISVIGQGDAVKATIKCKPGTAAAVLKLLASDRDAGPGVLEDKDACSIPESNDMLQPDAGPFIFFFIELVTQWSSDPTEINSTAMRHVVKR